MQLKEGIGGAAVHAGAGVPLCLFDRCRFPCGARARTIQLVREGTGTQRCHDQDAKATSPLEKDGGARRLGFGEGRT